MGQNQKSDTTFEIVMSWNSYHVPFGTMFHSSMKFPEFYQGTASLMLQICEVCDNHDLLPRDDPWRSMLKDRSSRIMLPYQCDHMLPEKNMSFTATIVSRKRNTVRGYFNAFHKQLVFRSGLEAENYLYEMMQCAENPALMTEETTIPYVRKLIKR